MFQSLIAQPSVASYDADYQAVLDRATALGYTLPDAAAKTLQNQFVLDLKAANIWTELDVLYPMLTNANFATLNWKAPTLYQLTLVNSPTYSAGFTGNGSSSYINTGWNLSTNAVKWTQNNAGFGCGISNNVQETTLVMGTANTPSDVRMTGFSPRLSPDRYILRINSATAVQSLTATTSVGRYHAKRTSSSALALFKNGSSVFSASATSQGLSTVNLYLLCRNANGTADLFSTHTMQYFWAGSSLTGLEATFDAILDTYY